VDYNELFAGTAKNHPVRSVSAKIDPVGRVDASHNRAAPLRR
jgi:hypothetical protein